MTMFLLYIHEGNCGWFAGDELGLYYSLEAAEAARKEYQAALSVRDRDCLGDLCIEEVPVVDEDGGSDAQHNKLEFVRMGRTVQWLLDLRAEQVRLGRCNLKGMHACYDCPVKDREEAIICPKRGEAMPTVRPTGEVDPGAKPR